MLNTVYDFKKEYKELYAPTQKPVFINVPEMTFIMADGCGNPNDNPLYQEAIEALYGLAYTIKMSKMGGSPPKEYIDFVVPPLEGLWWISDGTFDFNNRTNWLWTMMLRLPDFVTQEVFEWAVKTAKRKKPQLNADKARLEKFTEGSCVHALHIGPYANEPETTAQMQQYMIENALKDDIYGGKRHHHEIYLSDPRKTAPEKLKTILRHPVSRCARIIAIF